MKTPKHNIESEHDLVDCEDKIAEILADAIYEHIKKGSQKAVQNGDKLPMSVSKEVDNSISKKAK